MVKTSLMAALAAAFLATSGPASAQSEKEHTCALQGNLMAAIQQARMGGVAEDKLTETIKARNPNLSDKIIATVPAFAAHVYGIKMRDLKKVDLGAAISAQCLENWDEIQAMSKTVTN